MSSKKTDISLEDQIRLSARVGAIAGVKAYEERKKMEAKEIGNRKLYNTRLLLENYRLFNDHSQYATYKALQIMEVENDWLTEMYDPTNKSETIVESIKHSAVKTRIMVEHINKMLKIYQIYCESSPKMQRRYEALHGRYIADKRVRFETIAEKWTVDVRTIQTDIKEAVKDFSSLLFGINFYIKDEN